MSQAIFSSIRNHEIFVKSNLPSLDHSVNEFRTCAKDSELEYFQKITANLSIAFDMLTLLQNDNQFNKDSYCNTIASVALVHTSIQSD